MLIGTFVEVVRHAYAANPAKRLVQNVRAEFVFANIGLVSGQDDRFGGAVYPVGANLINGQR